MSDFYETDRDREIREKTRDLRAIKCMYENIGAKEKAKEIQKQIDEIEKQ